MTRQRVRSTFKDPAKGPWLLLRKGAWFKARVLGRGQNTQGLTEASLGNVFLYFKCKRKPLNKQVFTECAMMRFTF